MREHSFKKVNVLGIDVSVMRPERAANLSMEYMRRKGLETVFFLSAESSLYCQNQPWAASVVQASRLVLAGDQHMELALLHQKNSDGGRKGIGEFADEYLKKFFIKLNRECREIYAVMEKMEYLDSLREYIGNSYPDIFLNGTVFDGKTSGNPGKIVNEINANIPDVVFLCLPVEHQILFIKDYSAMMNTRLCICIESVQPLIRKEMEEVPALVRLLHLEEAWYHLKKDSIIRKTVVGSIFKKKVLDDTGGGVVSDGDSSVPREPGKEGALPEGLRRPDDPEAPGETGASQEEKK